MTQSRLTIAVIRTAVADYYGVKPTHLVSNRRTAAVMLPRHMGMYACRERTAHSLPVIGRHFGDRDHTTVLSACRRIKALIETDPAVAADWQAITLLLDVIERSVMSLRLTIAPDIDVLDLAQRLVDGDPLMLSRIETVALAEAVIAAYGTEAAQAQINETTEPQEANHGPH